MSGEPETAPENSNDEFCCAGEFEDGWIVWAQV